jgi:hypothetical protein
LPVTYNGHPAAGARTFSEVVPLWQGGARNLPLDAFREFMLSPSGVVAAGTDLSGAAVLNMNYDIWEITGVPAGSGVKFAAITGFGSTSRLKIIRCAGPPTNSNTVRIYASATGQINELVVGSGYILLEAGSAVMLYPTSSVNWKTIP